MGGGNFISQNKVVPGVYINTRSEGNLPVSVSDKGVVAICKSLSWGETGVVKTYLVGTDPTPIIGNNILSDEALFLREMSKGSDTTPAPIKVLIYRPTGTSGVKATATVGALTIDAKYVGTRGNDITVVIAADPDNVGFYNISIVVDGAIVASDYVDDLDNLESNEWVDYTGTGTTITTTAGTALVGGVDPTVSATDHASFMTAIEPYTFDILCYDGSDGTTALAYTAFAARMSNVLGKKCQVVMGGASAQNSEWAINTINGVKLSDGTTIDTQKATYWLAGAEAGAPYNKSLTYAQYPGAVESYPKKTADEVEAAIRGGNIVFIDEFESTKICKDINTLTSFTVEKHKEYSKNRVMRVLNQLCNDLYKNYSLYYIGKVDNNPTGRELLRGWVIGYLNEMQANNGIQDFTAEDVTVAPGQESDTVVITIAIMPVDSVEVVYATVNVRTIA